MNINLGMDLLRISEKTAIIGNTYQGLGDANKIIKNIRHTIGKDLAKLNYGFCIKNDRFAEHSIISALQTHYNPEYKEQYDLIVVGIEGHKTCSNGGGNCASFFAASEKGGFLSLPNLYMQKIAVNAEIQEAININQSITENIKRVARIKNTYIENITICILARERHNVFVNEVRKCGARILLIQDGDISGSLAAVKNNNVDMVIGYGGAQEGVMTAAAMKCIGGFFEGKIFFKDEEDKKKGEQFGIRDFEKVYRIEDLIFSNNIVFVATGITDGLILKGVRFEKEEASTYSLIAKGKTKTLRFVETKHYLDYKEIFSAI
jgi:fructose-1,6-bisphosphatase II